MKLILTVLFFWLSLVSSAFAADTDLVWSQSYDPTSGFCLFVNCDVARAVATDNSGVYYGGVGATNLQKRDLNSGNVIWSANTGVQMIATLAVDGLGVYVGGQEFNGLAWRWRMQKVDKNTGAVIWSQMVDTYTANNGDWMKDVCINGSSVYFVGQDGEGMEGSIRIERRSLVDGSLIWRVTEGAGSSWADAVACGLSADGNTLYIGGTWPSGKYQWRSERRDANSGNLVWANTASNPFHSNVYSLAVDSSGVYIGGYRGTAEDGAGNVTSAVRRLEKRDLANGNLLWNQEESMSSVWEGYQKLMSDNSTLYRLGLVAQYGDLFFEKINPANGTTVSKTSFVSSVMADTFFAPDWSFLGTSFYLSGSGKATRNWAMERRGYVPPCAVNQGQSCTSPANACGATNSGVIQCDGSCGATIPPNPAGYGNSCTSTANACGQTNTGTIQCNGSCSATTPSNPVGYGSVCPSAPNSCGQYGFGTIQCNGTCNAVALPDSSCPVNGTCGTATAPQPAKPVTNLCATGNASAVSPSSGVGPWSWSCSGLSGGSTASCSAPYLSASGAACPNAVCESSLGETPLTCSQDCKVKFRTF